MNNLENAMDDDDSNDVSLRSIIIVCKYTHIFK